MQKKQRSALRRFLRVREFLATHPVEGTQVKLQVLDEVIREMSVTGEEQDASRRITRGEVARQVALRDALWSRHMVPISRIARRVLGVPGMDVKLKLHKKRADNQLILDTARGMAQAASPHAEVFVGQAGLPSDFLQQLQGAIDNLAGALAVRVVSQRRREQSRETLKELEKRGIAAVDVLDAIVKPRLESKPDLLGAWNLVKRPIEPGGSSGGSAEPDIAPVVKVA